VSAIAGMRAWATAAINSGTRTMPSSNETRVQSQMHELAHGGALPVQIELRIVLDIGIHSSSASHRPRRPARRAASARGETSAVQRHGPCSASSVLCVESHILVACESILRIERIHLIHILISRRFGEDRGGADGGFGRIAADDRLAP